MAYYFFQVQFYWLFFYLLYAAALSKETFLQLNRAYLLAGLAAGLIFPMIQWESSPAPMAEVVMQPFTVTAAAVKTATEGFSDRFLLALAAEIYLIGAVVKTLRLALGLRQIAQLVRRGQAERLGAMRIVRLDAAAGQQSFSFLRWIFIPAGLTDEDGAKQIIRHEASHCRQLHSLDVLAVSILEVVFWFSPLIYAYRRSLQNVHEYLADRSVLEIEAVRPYVGLLVRQTQPLQQISFANHFIHSLIKKRILMMTKKRSSLFSAAKYGLVVPLALALAAGFGKPMESGLNNILNTAQVSGYAPSSPWAAFAITASRIDTQPVLDGKKRASGASAPNRSAASHGYRPKGKKTGPFVFVEQMPQYPDGEKALFKYLGDNIKYPEQSRLNRSEGTVFVNFTVDEKGNLTDFVIKKGVMTKESVDTVTSKDFKGTKIIKMKSVRDKDIDAEALRVLKAMPKWKPGRQGGVPVPVSYTLPIKFKLE